MPQGVGAAPLTLEAVDHREVLRGNVHRLHAVPPAIRTDDNDAIGHFFASCLVVTGVVDLVKNSGRDVRCLLLGDDRFILKSN